MQKNDETEPVYARIPYTQQTSGTKAQAKKKKSEVSVQVHSHVSSERKTNTQK